MSVKPSSELRHELSSRFTSQETVLVQDIEQALSGLVHGEITITVRSGKVIQIERVARTRPNHR